MGNGLIPYKPNTNPIQYGKAEPEKGGWSGVILVADNSPDGFGSVEAIWTIPNIGAPPFAKSLYKSNETLWNTVPTGARQPPGHLTMNSWVGFGNAGQLTTLWQGGVFVVSSLKDDYEGKAPTAYAWWEIDNNIVTNRTFLLGGASPVEVTGNETISNFLVSPGDLFGVKIQKANVAAFPPTVGSNIVGAATFTYSNYTRAIRTSFTLGSTETFLGNSVEWIVEQPGGTPVPGPITPRYGAVYFKGAECTFGADSIGQWSPAYFPNTLFVNDHQSVYEKYAITRKHPILRTSSTSSGFVGQNFQSGLPISSPVRLGVSLLRCTYELDDWTVL